MSWRGLFTSSLPPEPGKPRPWDRWDTAALVASGALASFVCLFKLSALFALAYTDDLFMFVQLATSWLSGPVLHDNHYGNHLAIHTYFAALPLAVFARPLGAPGLLVALSLFAGSGAFAASRLLRTLSVPGPRALGLGLFLAASPLALHVAHDAPYGFHLELLVPPLVLFLLRGLLERRLAASLAWATAILLVKEEMPVVVAITALLALAERRLSRPGEPALDRSVLAVLCLSLAALPVLVSIMRAVPIDDRTVDGFARLKLPAALGARVTNGRTLVLFVLGHPVEWLTSRAVATWLVAVLIATAGAALLRPHLLVLGLPLTGVAWLMDDSVIWPPRFAPSLGFAWSVGVLALASLDRTLAELSLTRRRLLLGLGVASALATTALALRLLPSAREVYLLSPASPYTKEERLRADTLFARYRELARPDEPVLAAPHLFRYAHVESLRWPRFHGWKEPPLWILWDEEHEPFAALDPGNDYELLAKAGRFSLHRRRGRT